MASILRSFALLSLALGALSTPVANEHLSNTPNQPHRVVARASCNGNNLNRCLNPTGSKPTDIASRSAATAYCSSFLGIPVVTSVIATSTPTTSITLTSTVTASTQTQISVSTSNVQLTQSTQTTTTTTFFPKKRAISTVAPPNCASTASPVQLSSACSCLGITASTTYVTATAPLATNTAIQLSSVTSTSTTLTTTTAVTGTTTVASVTIATATLYPYPPCDPSVAHYGAYGVGGCDTCFCNANIDGVNAYCVVGPADGVSCNTNADCPANAQCDIGNIGSGNSGLCLDTTGCTSTFGSVAKRSLPLMAGMAKRQLRA